MTKEKEFNLSKKRKELSNYGLEDTESLGGAAKFYREEDVKEFIRRLKEELLGIPSFVYTPQKVKHMETKIMRIINKLAGEKLI